MIPVVEGLLCEPYNGQLLTLLYHLAEWHALSKLRMHTERTLEHLDNATTTIGLELRSFCDWTQAGFTCKELPCETAARWRKGQKNTAKSGEDKTFKSKPPPAKVKPRSKIFNLSTYKFHALGDYVQTIHLFGTTDSYSTQIVRSPYFV
jgi:hypothetical protein